MTPAKLRAIAAWLDTYDLLADTFFDLLEHYNLKEPDELIEVRKVSSATEVQEDLRRWADDMEKS